MEQTIEKNKELIEKYPFLLPRNRWTGEVPVDYDYTYTELDEMPRGWRIAFGEQMCEEIKQALIKADALDKYRIMQIKEKYASLRWYDSGATTEVYDIIAKYEAISEKACIECGAPATKITKGWIEPVCDECAGKIKSEFYDIKEFYEEDKDAMD